MKKYIYSLVLIILLLCCFSAADVDARSEKRVSKPKKLICLELEYKIGLIMQELRTGYTAKRGRLLSQRLTYYKKLEKYYECKKKA